MHDAGVRQVRRIRAKLAAVVAVVLGLNEVLMGSHLGQGLFCYVEESRLTPTGLDIFDQPFDPLL